MAFETIVVGVDGSRGAELAVNAAIDIAGGAATLHVVAAFDPPSDSEIGRFIASLPAEFREGHDPTARAQEVLREASSLANGAGVRFVDHLVDADAATAILDVAAKTGADLIVVGCRGLGVADRMRRGSVSDRVVAETTRSVLVVHG